MLLTANTRENLCPQHQVTSPTLCRRQMKQINGRSSPPPIAGQGGQVVKGARLMKPLRTGYSEVVAYERISSQYPDLMEFTPQFFGTQNFTIDGDECDYLVLQNLAYGLKKAAIMDIKIGRSKNLSEEPLPTGAAQLLGCYVAGVQSENVRYLNRVDGYRGRQVSVAHFCGVLAAYFEKAGKQLHVLRRLEKLYRVMSRMQGVEFLSASLLFLYDESQAAETLQVYIIDFERMEFETGTGDSDAKTLSALQNVIFLLRRLWAEPFPSSIFLLCLNQKVSEDSFNTSAALSVLRMAQPHLLVSAGTAWDDKLAHCFQKQLTLESELANLQVSQGVVDACAQQRMGLALEKLINSCQGKGDLLLVVQDTALAQLLSNHVVAAKQSSNTQPGYTCFSSSLQVFGPVVAGESRASWYQVLKLTS